jgi:hypothetical protein
MLGSINATPVMSTRAQAYLGCKMATRLKKTFCVFKSYSRKSMSAGQGVYVEVL